MTPTPMLFDLLRHWEAGEGPICEPYMDSAKVWTIGYGHVIHDQGRPLRGPDDHHLVLRQFKEPVSPGWCRATLERDAGTAAVAVSAALQGAPTAPHEFDALVSLAFNIGTAAFNGSTVLRLHRDGKKRDGREPDEAQLLAVAKGRRPETATEAFAMWSKVGGEFCRGLFNRRLDEADLYATEPQP